MRRYKATIKAGRGLSEVLVTRQCGSWWGLYNTGLLEKGYPVAGPCGSERKLRAEVASLRRDIVSGKYAPR